MRIGLVAEGRSDLAVLVNILKGKLALDLEDIQFLRPEYSLDATDLHGHSEAEFSNWGLVKMECTERTKVDEFLDSQIDEERWVVIQIDSDEAELPGYDVRKPSRDGNADYGAQVRGLVVAKLEEWLGPPTDLVRFAVAVEETEAWILTLYSTNETSTQVNPKRALNAALNKPNLLSEKKRKELFQLSAFVLAHSLTKPFRKLRDLEACARRNQSLRLFVESLRP